MRKLDPTIADDMNRAWTYELPDGRRIQLDRRAVAEVGAAELIRRAGLEPFAPGEEGQMLPVYQSGRRIGQLPASFDPEAARSASPLFDIRPGDFKREGDGWTACRTLGPGDLGSLKEFVADRPEHYQPTALRPEEEALFASGGKAAGMEALLGRMLGRP